MKDTNSTIKSMEYLSPQMEVVHIATRSHMLQCSIDGTPGLGGWNDSGGSNSEYGLGGDD